MGITLFDDAPIGVAPSPAVGGLPSANGSSTVSVVTPEGLKKATGLGTTVPAKLVKASCYAGIGALAAGGAAGLSLS